MFYHVLEDDSCHTGMTAWKSLSASNFKPGVWHFHTTLCTVHSVCFFKTFQQHFSMIHTLQKYSKEMLMFSWIHFTCALRLWLNKRPSTLSLSQSVTETSLNCQLAHTQKPREHALTHTHQSTILYICLKFIHVLLKHVLDFIWHTDWNLNCLTTRFYHYVTKKHHSPEIFKTRKTIPLIWFTSQTQYEYTTDAPWQTCLQSVCSFVHTVQSVCPVL